MTPSFIALEHLAWCRRTGMSWADICTSVGSIGFDEADAFDAILTAACMAENVTTREARVEPARRLHLRVVA